MTMKHDAILLDPPHAFFGGRYEDVHREQPRDEYRLFTPDFAQRDVRSKPQSKRHTKLPVLIRLYSMSHARIQPEARLGAFSLGGVVLCIFLKYDHRHPLPEHLFSRERALHECEKCSHRIVLAALEEAMESPKRPGALQA